MEQLLYRENFYVAQCHFSDVVPWVMKKHYAKRLPSISYSYGLYSISRELVGIVTFGNAIPMQMKRGICGEEYQDLVYELNRLCIDESAPKNSASYLVSSALNMIPKPKIIISYSDMAHNHHGYVYQACNFIYTGLAHTQKDVKIRGKEHLHSRTLMDEFAYEKNRVKKLKEKYGDDFYYETRPDKHRYIYFCGDKRFVREMRSKLKYKIFPYPKGDNVRYDASGAVEKQMELIGKKA